MKEPVRINYIEMNYEEELVLNKECYFCGKLIPAGKPWYAHYIGRRTHRFIHPECDEPRTEKYKEIMRGILKTFKELLTKES